MRKSALIAALLALLFSCSPERPEKEAYLDWLYQYMPLPDSLCHSRDWWLDNVQKTLDVRDRMSWDIPEREFRHFVLPLRVNNEYLDDFRLLYADTLCARVEGLSLSQAALEINHWCHEQATYQGSDSRTSSPAATVRRGLGRCGEESTLTVAAMRAAGIPARQVYTPRWAHTDDNHAWVEVYTEDGKWHFLGACEPEPVLDLGWFNAPVSRALVLTTNVFGDYDGPESVLSKNECFTVINLIGNYVPSRQSVVTVRDSLGKAVEGAAVSYMIYNYAEFYPVASALSDAKGQASLLTGLGTLLARASKDGLFGYALVSSDSTDLLLSHKEGEAFALDFDIVPPEEKPLPDLSTPEQKEANKLRLAAEDSIRASHSHANPDTAAFRSKHPQQADLLFSFLSAKDLGDVTLAVLEDALLALPDTARLVLGPRVELEQLLPFREQVRKAGLGGKLGSQAAVREWISSNIKIVEGRNPLNLRIPPAAVLSSGLCDAPSLKIFEVALCRALGIPAELDEVTGETSYELSSVKKGTLRLGYKRWAPSPEYYKDFTISKFASPNGKLLNFGADSDLTPLDKLGPLELEGGYYYLTSGRRLPDGSVLSRLDFFSLPAGAVLDKELVIRSEGEKARPIAALNLRPLKVSQEEGGQPLSLRSLLRTELFIFAFLGESDEPSVHAKRQLARLAPQLEKAACNVYVFGSEELASSGKAFFQLSGGEPLRAALTEALGLPASASPLVALGDTSGRIYYKSKGYNPALAADLASCLERLNSGKR